jgi:hypothetical protein
MYLIAAAIFLVVLAVRLVARLAGYPLRPWLPQSGYRRYYADLVMTALVLLFVALLLGFHPSYGMAFGIVILASVTAMGLEARRKARPR